VGEGGKTHEITRAESKEKKKKRDGEGIGRGNYFMNRKKFSKFILNAEKIIPLVRTAKKKKGK